MSLQTIEMNRFPRNYLQRDGKLIAHFGDMPGKDTRNLLDRREKIKENHFFLES